MSRRAFACWLRVLGVSTALIVGSFQAIAHDTADFEYQLKAVFLLNFAKFVIWPDSAFAEASSPLTMCIIGDDPFGSTLDQVLQNEMVRGHPLIAVRLPKAQPQLTCHIAYIAASTKGPNGSSVHHELGRHALTVGEFDSPGRTDRIVNFLVKDGKVSFTINTSLLNATELKVSSKLLSLSQTMPETD